MSYLPLAHAFEQACQILMLVRGAKIGCHSGNVLLLLEDWKYLKPTIVCGVPRVFQKTIERIRKKMWWYLGWLGRAERHGKRRIRHGYSWGMNDTWYNRTIWALVRRVCGWQNVQVLVSGASPLPAVESEFLECLIGRPVIEGYGMTETFALGTHTVKDTNTKKNVGIPFDNVEVRLMSVPSRGYYASDKIDVDGTEVSAPRGEIQFRGPSIFQGYFKNGMMSGMTGADGLSGSDNEHKWLSTGDIGRINPNGTLSIIGRTKEIFKTKHGEYIAPRKVEASYLQSPAVNQIYVHGDSDKNSIMAVVVPDAGWAVKALKSAGLWSGPKVSPTKEFADAFSECAGTSEAKDALKGPLLKAMRKNEAGLNKRECVRDIIVETNIDKLLQGFTVSNGLITPTFKPRSKNLVARYRAELDALYTANNE